jgi:hypothetical protein
VTLNMTLILSINGYESVWLLADRRLWHDRYTYRDDARKLLFLETTDTQAILGYAGLGATAVGVEPSDWMSAVLRCQNLTYDQSLGMLTEAAKQQLPRHMARIPISCSAQHSIVATSLFNGQVRLDTIDLALSPNKKILRFRNTRHVVESTMGSPRMRAPRMCLAGSGANYLSADRRWIRPVLNLVNACDSGRISSRLVADHLAQLNYEVHKASVDKSVGPRCIVAWRNRRHGVHKSDGGGQEYYNGIAREDGGPAIPTVAGGIDVAALGDLLMPHCVKAHEDLRAGRPVNEPTKEEWGALLSTLPDKPDERLR